MIYLERKRLRRHYEFEKSSDIDGGLCGAFAILVLVVFLNSSTTSCDQKVSNFKGFHLVTKLWAFSTTLARYFAEFLVNKAFVSEANAAQSFFLRYE